MPRQGFRIRPRRIAGWKPDLASIQLVVDPTVRVVLRSRRRTANRISGLIVTYPSSYSRWRSRRSGTPLGMECVPPTAQGRMWAASITGSECSVVTAHCWPYASRTASRKLDCPSRGVIRTGLPARWASKRIAGPVGCNVGSGGGALQALRPHPQPLAARQILGAPGDDVACPVARYCHPLVGREEDRLGDRDAADQPVPAEALRVAASKPVESNQEIVLVPSPVGLVEDISGTPCGKTFRPREQAEPTDRVVLSLELEEERRPWRDRTRSEVGTIFRLPSNRL